MTEESNAESDPPQQISAEESLKRMKEFAARKEAFIAAVKKSEDRDLPAGARSE